MPKHGLLATTQGAAPPVGGPADYTLTIAVKPVELAPNRIVSTTTYNGEFPGPLLRFKENAEVTVDIPNHSHNLGSHCGNSL